MLDSWNLLYLYFFKILGFDKVVTKTEIKIAMLMAGMRPTKKIVDYIYEKKQDERRVSRKKSKKKGPIKEAENRVITKISEEIVREEREFRKKQRG